MSWTGPYMGFKHVELSSLGHIFPHQPPGHPLQGRHYERWRYSRGVPQEVFDLWKSATRLNTGAAQTWSSALPLAWHSSTWCADRSIDYMRSRDASKPFCMWVSFPDPHHPFDCPEPFSTQHHLTK